MTTQHHWRLLALSGLAALATGIVFALPQIPQDPLFHDFADDRSLCGLGNFWNVVSNLPFALIGLYGLTVVVRQRRNADPDAQLRLLPLACFFAGIALVAIGSAYYHWAPGNGSLFWDRLPMTLAFGSLLACMLADRVDAGFAVRIALPSLAAAGLASLLYWQWGEARGVGDLRPYLLLQLMPMLLAVALMLLFPQSHLLKARHLLSMLALYGLALFCEHHDWEIFHALNGAMSGHSIKHTLAALATAIPLAALRSAPAAHPPRTHVPPRTSALCSPKSATQGRQPTSQLS